MTGDGLGEVVVHLIQGVALSKATREIRDLFCMD